MSNPKFEIKKATNGEFYFNLKAGNGEKILTSEMYKSNQGCRSGIASVRVNAPHDVRYERKGTSGNYRFNLGSRRRGYRRQ
ncbi:YegP family protein [Chitinophaga sedimenti]|uniref:YegP family protein n=1 Tax=Chitinophaga sedimenti TaxID=2033606 RepID=UPI002003A6DB|nr:YegP family protein [Chitinophaga sedimenti]MCK7559791.1 YegP family protein [Chitinophaga sedimenti]